jgi:HK97 family phage major capsid protein
MANDTQVILTEIGKLNTKVDKTNAEVAELKNKATQSNYPANLNPGVLGRASAALGNTRDSAGYSLIKAVKFATGRLSGKRDPQIKEEMHIHDQLKKLYEGYGFMPHCGEAGFLVPFATEHIPDAGYQGVDGGKLRNDIKQKMAATVTGFDPDEARWIAAKAGAGMPWAVQKALSSMTDTAGGVLVGFPSLGELIDLQRNMEVFAKAGASEITLPPNGRIQFPKLVSGATASWIGEGLPQTDSTEGTGNLDLTAKKLGVFVKMNNELLRFATPSAEGMVRTDMARVAALKADLGMLEGTGGIQIKGLITYETQSSNWSANIDKLILRTASTTGAAGDTFSAADCALMEGCLPDEIEDASELTWVMRKPMFSAIMNRRADGPVPGDGQGPFLFWTSRGVAGERPPNNLYGSKVVRSSQVSNTRVKGAGTNLTYILLGRFADWITARMGVMEFLATMLGDTAFQNDQTWLRGIQHIDAGARHAGSFAMMDTLLVA